MWIPSSPTHPRLLCQRSTVSLTDLFFLVIAWSSLYSYHSCPTSSRTISPDFAYSTSGSNEATLLLSPCHAAIRLRTYITTVSCWVTTDMNHCNNTSDTALAIRAADLCNILAPRTRRKWRHLPVITMWPITGSPSIVFHTCSDMHIMAVI
jgi:hypothetical protein